MTRRGLVLNGLAVAAVLAGAGFYVTRSLFGPPLPPLLAGIDWGTLQADVPAAEAADAVGDAAFRALIMETFPVGSPTTVLTDRLLDEGFTLTSGHAVYENPQLMCQAKWQITWTDKDGTLEAVDGTYGRVCL